jgi:hypothetical protein
VSEVLAAFLRLRRPEDALAMFQEFGPWKLRKAFDRKGVPIKYSEFTSARRSN